MIWGASASWRSGFGMLQVVLDTGQRKDWFGSSAFSVWSPWSSASSAPAIPWVDLDVLKDCTFAAGVSLMTPLGFVLYGSLLLLPIFLETPLGYPALESGLALTPRGIASRIMMPVAGQLTNRFDPRKLIAIGLLVGWTMFSLSHRNLDASYWNIFWRR